MPLKADVEDFLRDFSFKLNFWGLFFRTDRTSDKNTKTLLALELNYTQVKKIISELRPEDYTVGPLPDTLYKISPMWVFGKIVKGQEVYIKIQLGHPDSQTICVSFHFPEYKMDYPFKK